MQSVSVALHDATPQGYAKFDLSGDEAPVLWYAPGGRAFCEELVVVPKASADDRDDAVWLLGLAYDPEAGARGAPMAELARRWRSDSTVTP